MAFSKVDLPADYKLWLAQDKPMVLGQNWARGAEMKWTITGNHAAADSADASWPTTYAADEQAHLRTRPDSSRTIWYFNVDLTGTAVEIDTIVILGHNLGSARSDIDLEVSNTADFAVAENIQSLSVPTDDDSRVVFTEIGLAGSRPQRYSGTFYFRIKMTKRSGGSDPQIGELILGRRRQLSIRPITPWVTYEYRNKRATVISKTGVRSDAVFYEGQRLVTARVPTDFGASATDMQSFFEGDTDYATLSWLWWQNPSTEPDAAVWMAFQNTEQRRLVTGFARQVFELNGIEKGPVFLASEA